MIMCFLIDNMLFDYINKKIASQIQCAFRYILPKSYHLHVSNAMNHYHNIRNTWYANSMGKVLQLTTSSLTTTQISKSNCI